MSNPMGDLLKDVRFLYLTEGRENRRKVIDQQQSDWSESSFVVFIGERDKQSLDLLIFFVVTIPLENHGELTSRARCVPLQYQSSATRGVKQALSSKKKPSNQNLIVVSTLLQERSTTTDNATNLFKEDSTDQVSQTGSGMFYELSNKRRMECERYQDCSWFQQDAMRGDLKSKLSLAETFEPIIDADEFDLPMQFANAHSIPWGDEYLEVFDDDILLEKCDKLGDKNKNNINASNGNYLNANYKAGEDGAFDTYNINFSLRKTDSFDSMKNISSTNPAEIIPISYKERLNNSNYGLIKLSDVRSEVKQEVDLYSPESNSCLLDSDEGDLTIGREEVVEDGNCNVESQELAKKDPVVSHNVLNLKNLDNAKVQENNSIKCDKIPIKTECEYGAGQAPEVKLELNLDLAKINFDQPLNVNTPDLDFMDLVEFINEEMHQENGNSGDTNPAQNSHQQRGATQDAQSVKNLDDKENIQSIIPKADHHHSKTIPIQPPQEFVGKSPKENSTVDFNDISGVSIAERIKTSAKRRTRKTVKDLIPSEDEDCESVDEDYEDEVEEEDDDDDYEYSDDTPKRRCASIKKRSRSSASESSVGGKRLRSESNQSESYRERRDKNNEASRRSRLNRKARERNMYKTLEEEERRNVKLKAEADVLEKQVTSLRQLLLQVVIRKGSGT